MAFHNVPPNGFPDIPDMEELEAVVKDVASLKTSVAGLTEDVGDLGSAKANKADIATEFSDLTNYYVGDLVYYEGALYEFQVDHTAGAWETSEVIQKDLSDIITTLKSGLTGHIFGSFTATASSTKGDVVTALNSIFTNLSSDDKKLCKIVRNDGYVMPASGNSGIFASTKIDLENSRIQVFEIDLSSGKYLTWSSNDSTALDISDWLENEGRTYYLVRG